MTNTSREAGVLAQLGTAGGGCPYLVRATSSAFARGLTMLRSALLEIFDEAAYARFLARRAIPSSVAAYSEFIEEQQGLKARRPRCC